MKVATDSQSESFAVLASRLKFKAMEFEERDIVLDAETKGRVRTACAVVLKWTDEKKKT